MKNMANMEDAGNDKEISAKQNKWARIENQLKVRLGAEIFNSWFGRLKLESISGGVAVHSVPTAFLKSWINSHYRDLICELWQKEDKNILRADIMVRSAIRRNAFR